MRLIWIGLATEIHQDSKCSNIKLDHWLTSVPWFTWMWLSHFVLVLLTSQLVLWVFWKLSWAWSLHVAHQLVAMVAEHYRAQAEHYLSKTRVLSELLYVRVKFVYCVTRSNSNPRPDQHRLISLSGYLHIFFSSRLWEIKIPLLIGIKRLLFRLFRCLLFCFGLILTHLKIWI